MPHKISIHAAREGGDWNANINGVIELISIHAAREGGDMPSKSSAYTLSGFQSTPPVKAATNA